MFQAATLHALKPVSRDRWLDPVAALYPKFLFEDVDDSTVLQPARQQLIELYGTDAIIKLRTPAPECFALDALHVRPGPVQGPNLHNHAVILCPGANGYYEDSFTFMFVQWVRHHVGDVHIIAANYAGTYRSEGFLNPCTMARSVYTAVAYVNQSCDVPIDNILLYAQSMGGMAAVLALPLLRQEWPSSRVRIISDRSFDSFGAVMPGFIALSGIGAVASRCAAFVAYNMQRQFKADNLAAQLHEYGGHVVVVWSQQDDLIGSGNHVSTVISALPARPGVDCWIVKMLPNASWEGDISHARRFYDAEIAEIFSGHARRLLNLENALGTTQLSSAVI